VNAVVRAIAQMALPGSVNWRRFGGVSAIAVFFACSVGKASGSITEAAVVASSAYCYGPGYG
jgi:hypothetical protein